MARCYLSSNECTSKAVYIGQAFRINSKIRKFFCRFHRTGWMKYLAYNLGFSRPEVFHIRSGR